MKTLFHHRFDSLEQFLNTCQGQADKVYLAACRAGDISAVTKAEAILADIRKTIRRDRPDWGQSVAGAFPIVPEFLSGNPECMRRRVNLPAENSPVTIWVCVNSSGNAADVILSRGIAILALYLELSRRRQCSIYICAMNQGQRRGLAQPGHFGISIRVRNPVNLAQLAYSICDETLWYRVMIPYRMGVLHKMGYSTNLKPADCIEQVREVIQPAPQDIVIPPNYADHYRDISENPAKWVKGQLAICDGIYAEAN